MTYSIAEHIPINFDALSRVWIYQCSRLFLMSESLEIEDMSNDFVASWQSHGAKVKGYANLIFGQFLIIMADETQAGVSGCSTDSSVHLVKNIEQKFKVSMFDRQNLAFIVNQKIQLMPLAQLNYAIQNNFITTDTIYFNNMVQTKQELLQSWMIPVKDSWLMRKIKPLQIA